MPVVDEDQEMVDISCFNTLNNVILTYFLRNKRNGGIEFVYFSLDDKTLTPKGSIHKIKIARKGYTLASYVVVEGDKHPYVMTICKLSNFTNVLFRKSFLIWQAIV